MIKEFSLGYYDGNLNGLNLLSMATKDMHGCDVRACGMALQSVETDTLSIFHGRLLLILFFIFQNGVTMLMRLMVSH